VLTIKSTQAHSGREAGGWRWPEIWLRAALPRQNTSFGGVGWLLGGPAKSFARVSRPLLTVIDSAGDPRADKALMEGQPWQQPQSHYYLSTTLRVIRSAGNKVALRPALGCHNKLSKRLF